MTYPLPLELQNSYLRRTNYPENLVPSGTATHRSKLVSYRKRLDEAESDLCLVDGEDAVDDVFEIGMIDLETGDGKGRDKKNIHTPAKLTAWLAVAVVQNPSDQNVQQVVAQKRDPKCRFIYFYGENSRDKLKMTRDSLCQIMSYHQVMPVYLDFMLVFGAQSDAKDLRYSGFREQIRLKTPSREHVMPELGRSGKHYQLCYNLKSVHLKNRSNENIKLDEWSIRDAGFYHQFDVEYGTSLWIVTKGGRDVLDRYDELTGSSGRREDKTYRDPPSCFRSTLATHLLYCNWSTEDWRWYICWLERVVENESGMAVDGLRGVGYAHKEYEPWDIQDLQHWQDKTNETVMVLEANAKILRALHKFYSDLIARKDFPQTLRDICEDDLDTFFSQLDEITSDFDIQISRAKLLVNIISDRKELVLQHLQSQASERTEQLNKNLEREAIVMRIITIVTLLYLPATFVSTFFSTDVIKYQDQNQSAVEYEDGSFSALALKRWLQVTIPLTALTLLGAWSTYRIYDTSPRHPTFAARLKRTLKDSKSSETSSYAPVLPENRTNTHRSVEKATKSLSRLALSLRGPRTTSAVLPLHEGASAKAG